MPLKLACADFTFPLLTHPQALDLIALLGFDGVDIGLFEGRSHLRPSTEFAHLDASAKALANALNDRGLVAADIYLQTDPDFATYAPNHPDPARRRHARDQFTRTLDYANACGARHVSALPGVAFPEVNEADSFRLCCDELAWRAETAQAQGLDSEDQALGLIFGVEAHVGSIAPTPEAAARLVRSTPGLTLTLDYTHFTRAGIADAEIEPLVPLSSHFHARCARPGRLQCAFPQNTIDYGRVLDVMRSVGYSGHVGVEYVWIDWEHCNEVDNLSETILLRDFLRNHRAAG